MCLPILEKGSAPTSTHATVGGWVHGWMHRSFLALMDGCIGPSRTQCMQSITPESSRAWAHACHHAPSQGEALGSRLRHPRWGGSMNRRPSSTNASWGKPEPFHGIVHFARHGCMHGRVVTCVSTYATDGLRTCINACIAGAQMGKRLLGRAILCAPYITMGGL